MDARYRVDKFVFTGALGIHENLTLAVRMGGGGFSTSADIYFPWRSALTYVI